MKILHLIDSFAFNGSARQLHLLGPALANDATSVEICCLGPTTPWLESLRQTGLVVHALDWTRWIDPAVFLHLHSILRESAPDVIHVWRLPTLRILALVAADWLPRVVMSAPLPAKGALAWWDRQLLKRVRCLALADDGDRERCIQMGVPTPMLRVVPSAAPAEAEKAKEGVTPNVVCVGRLERDHGFRNAVWAFDFVRYLFPEASLQIVGDGSERAALQGLALNLHSAPLVHFLGPLVDAALVLRDATVVWIPSLANCGRQVAIESMALGRAVIASDVPCLRALIDDGVTGFLAPPGDVVALARRTRALLRDRVLRDRLGSSAQQQVQRKFARQEAIERWQDVYRSAAA